MGSSNNKNKHLHTRIDTALHGRLESEARKKHISVSALVRQFIREGMDRVDLDERVLRRILEEMRRSNE
jgi:predicted HicB family RNase H-like nuclease